MINWKEFGRKQSWPNSWYCDGIYLKGLRNPTNSVGITSVLAQNHSTPLISSMAELIVSVLGG
jgi:hypothetical protein